MFDAIAINMFDAIAINMFDAIARRIVDVTNVRAKNCWIDIRTNSK